ncbi:hypothetical protein HDU92_000566 [Lobulomyces angularis]|nr:hypothetical protein HDU92_000566 [Lobulomyces angularis]
MSISEVKWMFQELKFRRSEKLRWWIIRKNFLDSTASVNSIYPSPLLYKRFVKEFTTLNIVEKKKLNVWLNDRVNRKKPLQYILGIYYSICTQPFNHLNVLVRPPILIPRPETEEITAYIANEVKNVYLNTESIVNDEMRVLECCTGSGCISLSLFHELKKVIKKLKVYAFDKNLSAVKLANLNKRNLICSKEKDDLTFFQLDMFNYLEYLKINGRTDLKFNLIIANPPYITKEDYLKLEDDVKLWEDKDALFDYTDTVSCIKSKHSFLLNSGLGFFFFIVKNFQKYLTFDEKCPQSRNLPKFVFEFGGEKQSLLLLQCFNTEFKNFRWEIMQDSFKKDRFLLGYFNWKKPYKH